MRTEFNEKSKLQPLLYILLGILGTVGLALSFVFSSSGEITDLGSLQFFIRFRVGIIIISVLCCILFFALFLFRNRRLKSKGLITKRFILSFLSVLISAFVILLLFIYAFQDELISKNNLIFQPAKITQETADSFASENIEEINLSTEHNIQLHGWLVKNPAAEKSPLIIYFGGSGQEVSNMIPMAAQIKGYDVALVNYRGFGTSEGAPSQDAVFHDAALIYDTLSKRKDIDEKRIITMGWSLGSAVSVYLADHRPIAGTILIAPIDSKTSKFQSYVPFIPFSLLLHQKFDSLSRAGSIDAPLLCLIGDSDKDVSPKSSMKLVKKWKGPHTVKTYKNEDHFLLFHSNDAWTDIESFLNTYLTSR